MKKLLFVTLVILFASLLSACTGGLAPQPTSTPAPQASVPTVDVASVAATAAYEAVEQYKAANPTATPPSIVAPTEPPAQPAAPDAPKATETPAADTKIACESIMVSTDGGKTWVNAGLPLETESKYDIGKRVTWTARSTLIDKAPDVALTPDELKTVEQTWIDVKYRACDTEPVIFTGGVDLGDGYKFDTGALLDLGKGQRLLRLRNGELVLWFDQAHLIKDIQGTDGLSETEPGRLITQIRNGNFDIHGPLSLKVTDNLQQYLPADILKDVDIIYLPK